MSKTYEVNGIPGYDKGRLTLKVSRFWLFPSKLYLDKKPLKKEKGCYLLGVKNEVVKLKFKKIGFDPVPKLSIDGAGYKPILTYPLTYTEQFWCIIPFLVLFNNFSIGAFIISCFFSLSNLWLFHTKMGIFGKYFFSITNTFLNCFFVLLIQHILTKIS